MTVGRGLLGLGYITAGVAHCVVPQVFAVIVPEYLSAHREIVVVSGVLAIAGGVGILVPATRRVAAVGLVGWLLAVFPANLWMAQHPERFGAVPPWVLWARLPLQVPMVWWTARYIWRE